MPETRTSIEGLYVAGTFRVYPGSRNMNNVLDDGFRAADLILADARRGG
jgi:thioredoxin reductase